LKVATVKIVSGPTSTNAPAAQTQDVHSSVLAANAIILGTSGAAKPAPNGAASTFQLCSVPVHISPDGTVSFLVNQGLSTAMWVNSKGQPAP
jgi:hypothetical protein